MKSKAAILIELNKPLEIEEVDILPLMPGQVLVQMKASGVCGAQLQEISGQKGNGKFLPHLMGHEGCGVVVERGTGVTSVKEGDTVIVHWMKGEGMESSFPQYKFKDKIITSGKCNTFATYAVVSENRVTAVGNNTYDKTNALLGCALSTAAGVVNKEAQVKIGESVLVIGCGGLGLSIIQCSRIVGAGKMIGVDISAEKKYRVQLNGANFVDSDAFCLNNNQFIKDYGKFDYVFDTTGSSAIFECGFRSLSDKGKYFLVGQPRPGINYTIPNAFSLFDGVGKTIKATQGGQIVPQDDLPRYANFFAINPQFSYDALVSDEFQFEKINTAIKLLQTNAQGRIMLHF